MLVVVGFRRMFPEYLDELQTSILNTVNWIMGILQGTFPRTKINPILAPLPYFPKLR